MRVVICGASSLVGTHLTKNLISQKHEIVRIGREHFRDVKYLKNSPKVKPNYHELEQF